MDSWGVQPIASPSPSLMMQTTISSRLSACPSNPSEIVSPKVTSQHHSIYLLRVSKNERSIHTQLVLRVSGQHLPKIKTDNEIAIMEWIAKNTTILLTDVLTYNCSDGSPIVHEYTLLSRLEGAALSEIYQSLDIHRIDCILDQLADSLAQLQAQDWDAIGGLSLKGNGTIVVS
ncbi:hypothetical protein MMC29_002371 [Sticta canariensis]|nr:hypothetical protein [Sticta canariensis]